MDWLRDISIVIALGLASVLSADAGEKRCSYAGGVLTGSISDNVVVDRDCEIDHASVSGNVAISGPYALAIGASEIHGNIGCASGATLWVTGSLVDGNIGGCREISLTDSEVRGNVECGYGGKLSVTNSVIDGNVERCTPGGFSAGVFEARLGGFEEVPAISTSGSGSFSARVDKENDLLRYRLSYQELEGDVLFAHIHFARRATNGGVVAFLCSNTPPPTGIVTPACPAPGAVLEGALSAADVIGPAGQGLAPGEAEEAMRALRAGAAYVNVHTTGYPSGEIRGQIESPPPAPPGPSPKPAKKKKKS